MKKIGRYEIVEELGRGAMGVVYKASDPTIGRLVAIKVLSLEPSTEAGIPGARDIFMREARAAGCLSHPAIVTIHDALEDPETHNNYIVMEFVPGRTLESVLLSGPPFKPDKAFEIIRQVAEGLSYAHQQKIIHRDMKPANILLTEDGRAKITDFGIAKIAAAEGSKRTIAVMGTPSYMSPEQVKGTEVDGRSDLFSLGIVLYVMLTGQKPFFGDTAAVMFRIVYEDPILPSQINPDLSPGIDYLLLRCLSKDRGKRYASAQEFLDDLDDLQHGRPPRSEARLPMSALRVGERTVMTLPPLFGRAKSRGRAARNRSPWLTPLLGAAVVFLGVLVGSEIRRLRHAGTPSAPPVAPRAAVPAAAPEATSAGTPALPLAVRTSQPPSPPQSPAISPPGPELPAKSTAQRGAGAQLLPVRKKLANTGIAPGHPPRAASAGNPSAPMLPTASPVPDVTTLGARAVQLWCRYELKEGMLTVSSGAEKISEWPLRGSKKGGFMGIKGAYTGTLSRSIAVPARVRELTVHVASPEGSLDLSRTISAIPPTDSTATLQVMLFGDQLTVNWQSIPRPKH
jgi:eukaryotic-like serine/threonine-protein kinase